MNSHSMPCKFEAGKRETEALFLVVVAFAAAAAAAAYRHLGRNKAIKQHWTRGIRDHFFRGAG